ncbi:uncharacterized protein LOC118433047 isoform X2 [Folsomia candida]|nr:uncharacterized protein LOC118433047 isoform X2 [Folsomia candida]
MSDIITVGQLVGMFWEVWEPGDESHVKDFANALDDDVQSHHERQFELHRNPGILVDILLRWLSREGERATIELLQERLSKGKDSVRYFRYRDRDRDTDFRYPRESFLKDLKDTLRRSHLAPNTKIVVLDPAYSSKICSPLPTPSSSQSIDSKQEETALMGRKPVYNFDNESYIVIGGRNDLTTTFGIKVNDTDGGDLEGYIPWKRIIGHGRPYRKVSTKLIISEEMLSIMPRTAIIFLSPPRDATSTEEKYRACELNCLNEILNEITTNFVHIKTFKIDWLRQLIIYDMNFPVLKFLANADSVLCNFVLDNPQNIAEGMMYPNAFRCLEDRTDRYFKRFQQIGPQITFYTRIKNMLSWLGGYGVKVGGQTVKVALLDTGVNLDMLPDQRCFTSKMKTANDGNLVACVDDSDVQHGTKVGYILSRTCHPCTKILPIKVLDSQGQGDLATITRGLHHAKEYDAQIINCSFNFKVTNEVAILLITNVFNEYYNQCNGKVLPVISAGNSSNPDVLPPGHLNSVISVGALTWDRTWCEFSSGKCAADVATFGENLILRLNRQEPCTEFGTSLTASAVSGLLTRLVSEWPELIEFPKAKELLVGNADNVEQCASHPVCQKMLNPNRAYTAAEARVHYPAANESVGFVAVDLRGAFQDMFDP